MDTNKISFGALPSANDHRTLTAPSFALAGTLKAKGKVALDFDMVNDLCDQKKLGICTMCGVRMAVEHNIHDGVRLDEYWGYLMGKVIYDDPLYGGHFEGSSALTMLKVANRYGLPEKKFCEKFPLKKDGTYQEFIADFKLKYKGKIPQEILDNATKHKISGYYSVPVTPASVAKEIQNGKIVICRFTVGDNTYKKENGSVSWLAKYLLPLRQPKQIDGGHLWDLNEFWKSGEELGGPNSWGREWCKDNKKQEAGYFWFLFNTQKNFFTEAWAIADKADKYVFKNKLEMGNTGADVVALQKILVEEGLLSMPVGVSYGFFGNMTKLAVIKYQEKYADQILKPLGLKKGTGFVGDSTIRHLNA